MKTRQYRKLNLELTVCSRSLGSSASKRARCTDSLPKIEINIIIIITTTIIIIIINIIMIIIIIKASTPIARIKAHCPAMTGNQMWTPQSVQTFFQLYTSLMTSLRNQGSLHEDTS
jgi:hypothetical protein